MNTKQTIGSIEVTLLTDTGARIEELDLCVRPAKARRTDTHNVYFAAWNAPYMRTITRSDGTTIMRPGRNITEDYETLGQALDAAIASIKATYPNSF